MFHDANIVIFDYQFRIKFLWTLLRSSKKPIGSRCLPRDSGLGQDELTLRFALPILSLLNNENLNGYILQIGQRWRQEDQLVKLLRRPVAML